MRSFGLVVALALLASGCTPGDSGPAPISLPPVSSETPVPSPVVASSAPLASPAVGRPPAVEADARTSATEFGRYWIDVLNDAYVRVNRDVISSISTADCTACRNLTQSLTAAARAGQRYQGGHISVREAVAAPLEAGETEVALSVTADSLSTIDAAGSVIDTVPAIAKTSLIVSVRRDGDRWLIAEVTRST